MERVLTGLLILGFVVGLLALVSGGGRVITDPEAFLWTMCCLTVGYAAGLASRIDNSQGHRGIVK